MFDIALLVVIWMNADILPSVLLSVVFRDSNALPIRIIEFASAFAAYPALPDAVK